MLAMVSRRELVPSGGFLAALGIVVTNIVGQGVFLKGRVMACEVSGTGSNSSSG